MNENERVAYVISQSVAALIEAMGMATENNLRIMQGVFPAYT